MYRTSKGERILLGAERRLFEESLAMMVDNLSVCGGDFGVPAFDQIHLDADPDKSRSVKEMMGISEDYYSAVAHDPPDHQLNLYRAYA